MLISASVWAVWDGCWVYDTRRVRRVDLAAGAGSVRGGSWPGRLAGGRQMGRR